MNTKIKNTLIFLLENLLFFITPVIFFYKMFFNVGVISLTDYQHFFRFNGLQNYIWDTANTGFNSPTGTLSSIPYTSLLKFFNFIFGNVLFDKIFLCFSVIFLLYSLKYFFRIFLNVNKYEAILGSYLFIFSFFTIASLSFGWQLIGFIPLACILLTVSFLKKYFDCKKWEFIFLSVCFSIFSFLLVQYFLLGMLWMFIYLIFFYKKDIKKFVLICMLFLLVSSFWLVPFVYSEIFLNFNHYKNFDLNISLNFMSSFDSYVRVFSLHNSVPGGPATFLGGSIYSIIASMVLFMMSIASFMLLPKNNKKLSLFLLLYIVVIFSLALGGHSVVYLFLFHHFSLFQIFRDVFKFMPFLLLPLISLFLLCINRYKNILSKFDKIFYGFLIGLFVMFYISGSYLLLTGNVGGLIKTFTLPQYYFDYVRQENSQKLVSNNLILPIPLWFSNFYWSKDVYQMQNPLKNLLKNPYIYDEFNNNNLNKIGSDIFNYFYKDYNQEEGVALFALSNVKNIILQKDQNIAPINFFNYSEDEFLNISYNILNRNFDYIRNYGYLYIFKNNKHFLPHFYTPQTLITTSQNTETLPDIVSQPNYKIRSAIYFNNPKQISAVTNPLATSSAIFNPQELKKETVSNTPVIEFKKINPTKYRIIIHHATANFPLVFSESFHDSWKTYLVADKKLALNFNSADYKILDGNLDDQASPEELKSYLAGGYISTLGNLKEQNIKHVKWVNNKEVFDYNEQYKIDFISKNFQDTIQNDNLAPGSFYETWFKKPVADNQNHLMVNGYANSWNINPTELCGAPAADALCVRNADGSYDLELVVEFWPQRLFYIGLFISGATLFGCLGYLGWGFVKRRKEKKKHYLMEGNKDN